METCVQMEGIVKSFGGVQALKSVDICVREGEIHALVGENGAGKSTLMKILSGAYQKDSGEMYVCGKHITHATPQSMRQHGIGIIYQEFALAPDLTVAENIYMGRMSPPVRRVRWKEMFEGARHIVERIGFDIDPRQKVGELSVAYQQIVEIAKTLSEDVRVLVLDEPTAVLSPHETQKLFESLRGLQKQGTAIIYISHRLDEIFELSDSITVLRDGEVVSRMQTADTDVSSVIQMMIGRKADDIYPKREPLLGEALLEVVGLHNPPRVQDVSFTVHRGEIFGISGLIGSGKTETARAIFGADGRKGGKILMEGQELKITSPKDAVKNGISYLSESRKTDGVLLDMPVNVNTTLAALDKLKNPVGMIRQKQERDQVDELIQKLSIKVAGQRSLVSQLSGGNQQKVSLAKWLYVDSKVLLLDEPTRGVDVGAKMEIYQIISDLAAGGLAIVVISSEMEEVCGLCDRVLVMHKGFAKAVLEKDDLTKEKILNTAIM